MADVVDCCAELETFCPTPDNGTPLDDTTTLRSGLPGHIAAYPISYGASFVMALEFTADGSVAEVFLTYGNPDDPSAPAYRAGLEAFSTGTWRPLAFTPEAVTATGIEPVTVTA